MSQQVPGDPDSVEQRLLRFIEGLVPDYGIALGPDTELFASGLVDSLALVQLLEWVEEEIGATIDASSVDLSTDWRRVRDVAAFIERTRRPRG